MTPVAKKKKITTVSKKLTPREVKPSKPTSLPNPSLRLYRRIAGVFIVAVVALLAVVILLSTTKAVVLVTPKVNTVQSSFLFDVVKEAASEGQIIGVITDQVFEQTKIFPVVSGEQKEVLDKAGGLVTIKNDSSKNQPLVATTRLLSSGGVLFRLDKGVNVPAGGSLETQVYADQVGSIGDIGPDQFTIPGLATSLQSQIYAESAVAMTGGKRLVSVVTQEELDINASQLQEEMEVFAKDQLRTLSKADWSGEVFSVAVLSKVSDTEPGQEKDEVTISLKIKVAGVFFNADTLNGLASAKLYQELEDGFVFKDSDQNLYSSDPGEGSLVLEVIDANSQYGIAQMRANLEKQAIVSNTHQLLQPELLVGKSAAEVKSFLVSAGLADDVSVWIFPPWIGKIPAMVDHVTVEVKD